MSSAHQALHAAVLFTADPLGLGGIAIKAGAGPARDAYLEFIAARLNKRIRKIPLQIQDERLLGGLDLSATLNLGRPVLQKGLLCEADGGVLMLPMAERVPAELAARLAAVMDRGLVQVQRDGLTAEMPARFGLIACDEGIAEDEQLPQVLMDRLAFHVDLRDLSLNEIKEAIDLFSFTSDSDDSPLVTQLITPSTAQVSAPAALETTPHAAALAAHTIELPDDMMQALCATAMALGIDSVRATLFALRTVRLAAALDHRQTPSQDDLSLAAQLVLSPRATMLPQMAPQDAQEEPQEEPQDSADQPPLDDADNKQEDHAKDQQDDHPESEQDPQKDQTDSLEDVVLEAAKAAIPAGLLAAMMAGGGRSSQRSSSSGRAGAIRKGGLRGRPIGSRKGAPGGRARLSVIDTLRTAAPWQRLRQLQKATSSVSKSAITAAPQPTLAAQKPTSSAARVIVKPEDFQITRFKQRTETTTIFVVDASGSSAIHRLAEAKGAVELLLADCYVRRDQVAVIAFRGKVSELILPPTRSLVRAKRSLSGLPGGGGTPLAHAIDTAAALAQSIARKGDTPVIVMLTDARANIARDGSPGRQQAQEDATQAAQQIRAAGFLTLLIDTSPQPSELAQKIALEMQARYLPLPHAGATEMSRAIKVMTAA